MKKPKGQTAPVEHMLSEYDFGAGLRGKYAERYTAGSNLVLLAPDVAEVFTDSDSVNEALRVLANLVRQRAVAPSGPPSSGPRPARQPRRG